MEDVLFYVLYEWGKLATKSKKNQKANKKSRRIRRLFLSFKIIAAFVAVIKAFFSYDPPRDEVVFLSKYGAKYSNPPVDAD